MDTNDYRLWLDGIDVNLYDRIGDIYALYHKVKDCRDSSQVVTLPGRESDKLTITSETRQAFLEYLDSLYCPNVDGEYNFRNSLGLIR